MAENDCYREISWRFIVKYHLLLNLFRLFLFLSFVREGDFSELLRGRDRVRLSLQAEKFAG